jgi:hypothetical protein
LPGRYHMTGFTIWLSTTARQSQRLSSECACSRTDATGPAVSFIPFRVHASSATLVPDMPGPLPLPPVNAYQSFYASTLLAGRVCDIFTAWHCTWEGSSQHSSRLLDA